MKKLGILISGRGSNMVALADAVREGRVSDAEIALVISNVATAGGLAKAQERGIPTIVFLKDGKLVDQLVGNHPKENFVERIEQHLT